MANIPSTPTWSPEVTQIETTDAVLGGPDGVINIQAKQLADRTAFLKQEVETAASVAGSADEKADSALAQIDAIETAAGNTQTNAAEALAHKQGAQAAQALAEQARNAAQAAQAQAGDNAGYAYQATQTAQLKAQEAQAAATAAGSAASAAVAAKDQFVGAAATAAAEIAELASQKVNEIEVAGAQALAPVLVAKDETLSAAADAGVEAALAQNAAVSAGQSRDAAAVSASNSQAAKTSAEAARDAAFVNANVYASTAAGLAATTDGQQFQVVSGSEIIRYTRTNATTATELARYPSASVTRDNTRRLFGAVEATVNIFNKDDPEVADNFFVNHTNGNLQANGDYWASGFIPVVAGQTYFIAPKNYMAWYSAGRVFISGSANTDTNNAQTAPAGAAFLRISLSTAAGHDPATAYVTLGSSALTSYVPYGGQIANDSRRIPNGVITPTKTNFLVQGKNLFNKSARRLNAIQSSGNIGTSTDYDLSDFIKVEEGKTYQYRGAAGGARFRACFNALAQNVTAQASLVETSSYTVPVGSGVVSMRLSIAKARVDDFLVEEAAAPTAFEPYGFRFSDNILDQSNARASSSWSGKKCSSYGDSITAQLQWQPKIAAELGLVHTDYGVGGRQIAGTTGMCQDAAVNTIPTDTELLLVLGGTNDWAQSRALGAANSTNTEEFYGALNQMAQKLTTRLPTCRIVWMTTPYGELPGRVTDGIWTTAHTNNAGLTTRAYAEAIRFAARRWGFPVIDLDECGWNEINLTTYMKADGGSIHPNSVGGTRMAEVAIGRLRDLEPVA